MTTINSGPSLQTKRLIALALVISLTACSVFLALGGPSGIAERPGIFGTKANLFSDLNLIAQMVLLIGFSSGMVMRAGATLRPINTIRRSGSCLTSS